MQAKMKLIVTTYFQTVGSLSVSMTLAVTTHNAKWHMASQSDALMGRTEQILKNVFNALRYHAQGGQFVGFLLPTGLY
jgi:hypothetical protein